MEIEVEFAPMTEMADKTMLTKYIIKNEAVREGKTVTFMPKPIYLVISIIVFRVIQFFKSLFYQQIEIKPWVKASTGMVYSWLIAVLV